MLPFRLVEPPRNPRLFPVYPYSVGRHHQFHHVRPEGFPVHQLFLVKSGTGLFRDLADGCERILGPGQAMLLPKDLPHEYFPNSSEPWFVGFAGFSGSFPELLEHGDSIPVEKTFSPAGFADAWEDIGQIWTACDSSVPARPDPSRLTELSAVLYRLLLRFRTSDAAEGELASVPLRTEPGGALQQAVRLMNQHYSEPLLISNLAQAVGYSVQHFQRLFQQEYGTTPHHCLQNLRFERAVQLIREKEHFLVQDIAGQLGMETNYFIRAFKKQFGCTPGEMIRRSGALDADKRQKAPLPPFPPE